MSRNDNQQGSNNRYLEGGCEMGGLTRSFDWSKTVIGNPDQWSQSLLNTISIMFNSKYPMFIWWGSELIQFYNDAYRPLMGIEGKHPKALGQKGVECWPEIWPVIKPLIDQVFEGEAVWKEDQLIPIYRNNSLEDVYWTFGYNGIRDETGKIAGVLVICNETTEKVKSRRKIDETLNKLAESEARLRHLLSYAPTAVAVLNGRELIIETSNKKMLEVWGKDSSIIGKPLHLALPELEGQQFLQLLDEVFTSGIPYYGHEQKALLEKNNKLEEVYLNFVYHPLKDEKGLTTSIMAVATIVTELVTARKELEFTIEATELATWDYNPLTNRITGNDRFKSWFGLPLDSKTDFDLTTVNQAIIEEDKERINTAIRKALEKQADGNYNIINTIINPKDHVKRVIKIKGKAIRDATGNIIRFMGTMQDVTEEYQVFVKLDDGILTADLNLIERKQAGLEKFKNFTILHQSERIAKMGSWEYDLSTRKLRWSDGMYRIFNKAIGTKVNPDIYLRYAVDESKKAAEYLIYNLENAIPFEETLVIVVDGVFKTIKIKATVISNEEKISLKFIGADIDITEQVKLQKEKEQLEKQQKDMQAIQKQRIFWTTLNAQEEERKRIAESLHNGLGQLLYGVKLSLEQLNINKELADPKWLKNKQRTDQLLSQSIQESRRISHELSPAILNDFGLQEAIKVICQQFRPSILINCKFIGFHQRLHKNIEIAIYRTVQELLMNIVKHAKASKAAVKIEMTKKTVIITVQDNGIGFNNTNKSNGIGLVTIRNKVKLLNGEFKLLSGDKEGSIIRISIPYETERDSFIH